MDRNKNFASFIKGENVRKIIAIVSSLVFTSIAPALPAFPGAEGFGSGTPGGRGGRVILVTNTNASGAGSFLQALLTAGPRIIVFRVSGVITMTNSPWSMSLYRPYSYLTIAGQTSPGGVTLRNTYTGGSILWCYEKSTGADKMHDAVFRHLRFRGADSPNGDGVTFANAYNFIFDHCDVSGGGDETMDVTHDSNFTVQWCTVSNSSACNGCQTYGMLMAYVPTTRISLHHNLHAHHKERAGVAIHWNGEAPADSGLIDYRNNVVYNGLYNISYFYMSGGFTMPSPAHVNLVGNFFMAGPNTESGTEYPINVHPNAVSYQSDNVWKPLSGGLKTSNLDRGTTARSSPIPCPPITTHTALQAYDTVLAKVGAMPRDPMNTRTVSEVRAGTGGFGKLDDAMITSGPAVPADADNDGMPDCWETAMGLDPNLASDNILDQDNDGYTNIEEYINDLALVLEGSPAQNFKLLSGCPTGVEIANPAYRGQGMSVAPSVIAGSGSVRITLSRQAASSGSVRATGPTGRVLAELPAATVLDWDCRGKNGSVLASGVYYIQWKGESGRTLQKRITVIN